MKCIPSRKETGWFICPNANDTPVEYKDIYMTAKSIHSSEYLASKNEWYQSDTRYRLHVGSQGLHRLPTVYYKRTVDTLIST